MSEVKDGNLLLIGGQGDAGFYRSGVGEVQVSDGSASGRGNLKAKGVDASENVAGDNVTATSALSGATGAISTADGLTVNGEKVAVRIPVSTRLPGTMPATAANFGVFFHADRAYTVVGITESHTTQGNGSGAVTLTVEKLTTTQAPDSGADLLGATKIDLKGSANVPQSPALTATAADLDLAAGDRLCLKDSGTLTSLAGLCVTVFLKLK